MLYLIPIANFRNFRVYFTPFITFDYGFKIRDNEKKSLSKCE
jgi:hypothetical protein